MLKDPVDHVGDGLEPAMRVPCRPLRLARTVLHLTHLVHVNEGVEVPLVEPVKGAPHGEALALDTLGRGRNGEHRTLDARGPVGFGDSGQGQDVVDADSGHGTSSNRAARAAIPDGSQSPPGRAGESLGVE